MRLPIMPGKAACAGLVVIFMVLPNSIWKGPDAKDASVAKRKTQPVYKRAKDSDRSRLELREIPR